MSFNLFGPSTKDDIKVGYVDPTLGYIDGVTVCEANEYAKDNPGTTFVFRDGDNSIKYININEVNKLTPDDLVSTASTCGGVQNYSECGPPRIQIYGGGGVGAVANPIIGKDGSLLAVDVVSGGHGYQYPPLVTLIDDCNIGSGAVLTAVLGETPDQVEVYEGEEDFEEYQICDSDDVGYGIKYDINGKELGPWDPTDYTRIGRDPIEREIEAFQRAIEKPFWTTRKYQPDRIIVAGEQYATQESTEVTDSRWSEFMNQYAVSPVIPSDSIGTDEAGKIFRIEWEHNFPVSGEYIFRGLADNVSQVYIDNALVGDLKSYEDNPSPLQKTIQEGNHTIRVDLLNTPGVEKVTKTTSTSSKLNAKFIQKGKDFYLRVDGSGSGEIFFIMDVNDSPIIAGLAAKEVIIPSDSGKVKFIRTEGLNSVNAKNQTIGQSTFVAGNSPTEEIIKKSGTFTGGNLYGPIQIIGAAPTARGPIPIKNESNKLALRDADGDDENIKITIEKIKGSESSTIEVGEVISSKSWRENPIAVSMIIEAPTPPIPKEDLPTPVGECPPNPIWTTRFPNSSQQWYPVKFSGPRRIVEQVVPSSPESAKETQEVEFSVYGEGSASKYLSFVFSSVDGQHTFTINGAEKSGETRVDKINIRKNVNYDISVIQSKNKTVEQGIIKNGEKRKEGGIGESNKIFGDAIGSTNDNDDMQVTANVGKFISSNKGKSEGRGTYDLTYRFEPAPGGNQNVTEPSTKTYDIPGWSSFMNRYAISPILPLNTPGSDVSGVTFSNSWEIDLPYSGFYGLKGTRDNRGRILIDGKEVSSLDGFSVDNPKMSKIYLLKGKHTITTEVINTPVTINSSIDTKVFSTQDWRVPGTETSSPLKAKFIQKGSNYYLQVDGSGSGEIFFVMDVNDSSVIAELAAKEVVIPSDSGKVKFIRDTNSVTIDKGEGSRQVQTGQGRFTSSFSAPTEQTIKQSGKFTGGNLYGPIEIIGAGMGARGPMPIKDGSQKLALRDADGDDENIKITIEKIKGTSTISTTPISQSPTKNGVTYDGPELFGHIDSKWSKFMNDYSVSPKVFNLIGEADDRVVGKYTLTWKNVNFPGDGIYNLSFQSDNFATLKIGGREIAKSSDFVGENIEYIFNATSGNYDIVIELENSSTPNSERQNDFIFSKNPMGVSVYISKKTTFTDTNKTPWTQNPIGISAILIPPPCAKKIGGKGVVKEIIPKEPGNGYPSPPPEVPTYNVKLILTDIIPVNPGINYRCGEDQIKIVPDNGAKVSYTCDSFGRITEVKVKVPGNPFTIYPSITIPSETGVNAKFIPVLTVIRDPIVPPEQIDQIIQVTDLVGLKQTGYVDGRAYYGAIYYDNGIPYAGYYKTAGPQTRVYATLQESITAQVTTPPSAIQRSGTDIRSNDPRLNIPGTIQDTE